MKLKEGLEYEDLKGLVSNNISIDQYKPKIGEDEDTVVVAFTVTYENPAKDLSHFIETSNIDHLDVEVSSTPDEDGAFHVFIEFKRDLHLFEKIEALLHEVDQITSRDDGAWTYRAYHVKKEVDFNKENFDRDIIDSRVEYRKKYSNDKPVNELEESWSLRLQQMLLSGL